MASTTMAAADAVNDLRAPVRRGRLAFLWQALRMDKLALLASIALLADYPDRHLRTSHLLHDPRRSRACPCAMTRR